jgi:hypothetical protein
MTLWSCLIIIDEAIGNSVGLFTSIISTQKEAEYPYHRVTGKKGTPSLGPIAVDISGESQPSNLRPRGAT